MRLIGSYPELADVDAKAVYNVAECYFSRLLLAWSWYAKWLVRNSCRPLLISSDTMLP